MPRQQKKANIRTDQCVACGCCMKICPRNAIAVPQGIFAEVDKKLCVGCGKCVKECPASIISLEAVSI